MDIKVSLNESFSVVHQSEKRIIAMKGSAGSGKSVDTAQTYILRLMKDKGRNLLCVRKSEVTNRDSTFAELISAKNRMGIPDKILRFTSNPMRGIFANGNEILFRGVNNAKEQEKLKSVQVKSGKLTDIWIEEATELTRENVDILEDRLRGVLPEGQFFQMKLTFNPVSTSHWIKSYYFDKEHDDVLTHHSTFENNAFIDEAYAKRMARRKEQDPQGYRIYGLGEWGELKGLILEEGRNWHMSDFNEEWNISVDDLKLGFNEYTDENGETIQFVYVSQKLSDYDDLAIGQDFGHNHASALTLWGLKGDDIYLITTVYEYGKTTSKMIDIAKGNHLIRRNIQQWADSAEPDRIEEWSEAGYMIDAVSKEQNSVASQIDWLKARNIFVHHSNVDWMKEARQWKWKYNDKTDTYEDVPVKSFDDAMASMRYAIEGWRKGITAEVYDFNKAFYGNKPKLNENYNGTISDAKFDNDNSQSDNDDYIDDYDFDDDYDPDNGYYDM